jgi:hypothetical protein
VFVIVEYFLRDCTTMFVNAIHTFQFQVGNKTE